jgi:hypothetical protein
MQIMPLTVRMVYVRDREQREVRNETGAWEWQMRTVQQAR